MSQRPAQPTCHHYCNTWNCPECMRRFWRWAEQHTQGRGRRTAGRPNFYEAAARNRNPELRSV